MKIELFFKISGFHLDVYIFSCLKIAKVLDKVYDFQVVIIIDNSASHNIFKTIFNPGFQRKVNKL